MVNCIIIFVNISFIMTTFHNEYGRSEYVLDP